MGRNDTIEVLWLKPGKAENISVGRQRITEHLREQGIEVTLVATTPKAALSALLSGRRYDVVVGTTRAGAIVGALVSVVTCSRLIVDHIDPIDQLYETSPAPVARAVEFFENISFRIASRVLYVYDEEEERVRRWARDSERTSLGVEYDRFAEPADEAIEAAESRLSELDLRENVAVYVGGLEPIYNLSACIRAIDELDDWSLLLLGSGSLEDEIERQAADRDRVHFLGTVPHEAVPGYLYHGDVGLSLVDDPHTLKVLEYLAVGLGVVQLEGDAEDRFDGLVTFSSTDPVDIARAIRDASETATTTDTAAYVEQFDWAAIADLYARNIRDVIS